MLPAPCHLELIPRNLRPDDHARESDEVIRVFPDALATMQEQEALILESRVESVDEAERAAAQAALRAGFGEDEAQRISMAVREITVNAVMHGNGYDRAKKVRVEFLVSRQDFVVSICDEGSGFDPSSLADPLAPENLLRQSGRGIFLARAFMDEVDVQPSSMGTSVRLVKRRPIAGVGQQRK